MAPAEIWLAVCNPDKTRAAADEIREQVPRASIKISHRCSRSDGYPVDMLNTAADVLEAYKR